MKRPLDPDRTTRSETGQSPLVAVRVPEWMKREIGLLAKQGRRSEADYVRELFRSHIESKTAGAPPQGQYDTLGNPRDV